MNSLISTSQKSIDPQLMPFSRMSPFAWDGFSIKQTAERFLIISKTLSVTLIIDRPELEIINPPTSLKGKRFYRCFTHITTDFSLTGCGQIYQFSHGQKSKLLLTQLIDYLKKYMQFCSSTIPDIDQKAICQEIQSWTLNHCDWE